MQNFEFKWLAIERLIAHTIYGRGPDKKRIDPSCSNELLKLDGDAVRLIQVRITEALGHTSHGVEVAVQSADQGSFMQTAASMVSADDDQFIRHSKFLANKLADAQTHSKWPGGVLIVMAGKVGTDSKPYIAAIKAETDKGFNFEIDGDNVTLKLIKNMLLSATQRLYKIGLLVELSPGKRDEEGFYDASNYRAFLFDHLLTATETKNAATYFYSNFLGMDILRSAKHHTRTFYEESKNFINSLAAPEEDKQIMREALRTTLRSNVLTINARDFADEYLPEENRKDFLKHLSSKMLPEQAFVKDTEYIHTRLRRPRQVNFTSGVQIRVPADQVFADLLTIEGEEDGYTSVRVRGGVQGGE